MLVASKEEDSPIKDSMILISVRELGYLIKVSMSIYESMYSLGNTRCIYRTFLALDPCDKTGNVILININKITTYPE